MGRGYSVIKPMLEQRGFHVIDGAAGRLPLFEGLQCLLQGEQQFRFVRPGALLRVAVLVAHDLKSGQVCIILLYVRKVRSYL